MNKKFKSSIPRVKICCISSIDEADIAIRNGADALGLVADMPSGPGVIPEELIYEIARFTPPAITSVLLTSQQSSDKIISQHSRCQTNAIQLCDHLVSGSYADLRQELPGISLIQVIHVSGEESVEEALNIESEVDAILLDSGSKNTVIKELGGTGRSHDWTISKQICRNVSIPVFLAGGLNPENILEAISVVQPFTVDVCSGVRTNGLLDEEKVADFISRVKNKT
jgi:phosphoribosylanthranilate isomerase